MATRLGPYNPVQPAALELRGAPRLNVRVSRATARDHGKTADEAALHDLSVYGCRMMLEKRRKAGDRLWIRFDGALPVAATVVWYDDGLAGCRFDEPIERSVMRKLTIGAC